MVTSRLMSNFRMMVMVVTVMYICELTESVDALVEKVFAI